MNKEPINLEEVFRLHQKGIKVILGVRIPHQNCYYTSPTSDPKRWDDRARLIRLDEEATLIEIAEEDMIKYNFLVEENLAEYDGFGNKNPLMGRYRFMVDFGDVLSEYSWNSLYLQMYDPFAPIGKSLPMPERIEDFFYLKNCAEDYFAQKVD